MRLTELAALNNVGQVAGTRLLTTADGFLKIGYFWDPDDGVVSLGWLFEFPWSEVADMNDAGQVVGLSAGEDTLGVAFLWTKEDGMMRLPTLRYSTANGVNDNGQVVGRTSSQRKELGKPYIWSAADGFEPIGNDGYASAINNAAQIVGFSTAFGTEDERATLWTNEPCPADQ